MEAPFRRAFDAALNPLAARNALGIEEGGSGGGGAPTNAQYIVAATDPVLTNERVLTDTATVTWDFTVAGQAKATAVGAGGGGGNVSNSGTPTLGQYAKWTTATTIQGVAPATVLSDIGAQPAGNYQPLDADLTSLAAAAATNVLYYRSAANTWGTVTVTAPVTFTAGTLSADLSAYLTSAAAAATYQPLDADLTAIAALTGTNVIYYRSAANTWAAVTIGTGLSFTGGTLASTVSAGGNVSNSGTPVAGQVAEWVDATHIAGVSTYAKLASPTFTGDPKAPTPTAGDNDTSIATTAFVTAAVTAAGGAAFRSILVTTKTSGSGNHTLNANCVAWEAWWVGGGGGGGGSASGAGGGGTGGATTFAGVSASGGSGGGPANGLGGIGGTGGAGTATWRVPGGLGGTGATAGSTSAYAAGGQGASSFFGGGSSTPLGGNGNAATVYGAGAGGGSSPASVNYGGGGGGAGEFCYLYNGAATGGTVIAYSVGGGGNQGPAGSGGFAGGSGAAGFLVIKEYLK